MICQNTLVVLLFQRYSIKMCSVHLSFNIPCHIYNIPSLYLCTYTHFVLYLRWRMLSLVRSNFYSKGAPNPENVEIVLFWCHWPIAVLQTGTHFKTGTNNGILLSMGQKPKLIFLYSSSGHHDHNGRLRNTLTRTRIVYFLYWRNS